MVTYVTSNTGTQPDSRTISRFNRTFLTFKEMTHEHLEKSSNSPELHLTYSTLNSRFYLRKFTSKVKSFSIQVLAI